MTDLNDFARLAVADGGLCIAVTTRRDGSAQASLVSAGVADNPLTHRAAVAFVAGGNTRKLVNLRQRPRATAVAKSGYQWATAEGTTTIIGPDDPQPGFDD